MNGMIFAHNTLMRQVKLHNTYIKLKDRVIGKQPYSSEKKNYHKQLILKIKAFAELHAIEKIL